MSELTHAVLEHPQYVAGALPLGAALARSAWNAVLDRLWERNERLAGWDHYVRVREAWETREDLAGFDMEHAEKVLEQEARAAAAFAAAMAQPRSWEQGGGSSPDAEAVNTLAESHGVPASVVESAVSYAAMQYTADSA